LIALVACSPDDVEVVRGSAIDHGHELFDDPRASPSQTNKFACSTCHPGAAGRLYPGAPLGGVTERPSFWGGKRADLLESINDCRLSFMDAPSPWTAIDEDARALFAYLASLDGPHEAIPFTVVTPIADVPPEDRERGRAAFSLACKHCHGSIHDGAGRLVSFAPILPDDIEQTHAPQDRRLAIIRKIRASTGSMPPFAREVLSDADVGAILAYLGQ
jgi:mono/diheme cytochrome c family protein